MYSEALALDSNNSFCKYQIHLQLLTAYNQQEQLTGLTQLRLYFFHLELESVNRIIYYSGKDSEESRRIIAKGQQYFARLRLILAGESSQDKASYLEKVFVRMNTANADFRCRLAWYISKAYYKQCLTKIDGKDCKKAFGLC